MAISVSAPELAALQELAGNQRAPLSVVMAAELEKKGLVMRGWDGMHVLTAEGEAALRGLGSLILIRLLDIERWRDDRVEGSLLRRVRQQPNQ
ncbi:MAG: hypothetical protein Q8M37_07800 [Nevskia sp.]|nr:hypothetical protein [Nevskia sp.]